MNQKELSPADIYAAMNTTNRDDYDREVTSLRKSGVLAQIRSQADAQNIAYKNKIEKRRVPRFKVVIP